MEELKRILVKPPVKHTILAIFTLVTGIIPTLTADSGQTLCWYLFVGIIYIITLIKYSKLEENLYSQIDDVTKKLASSEEKRENQNKVFRGALRGINAMCRLSAQQINLKIHEIIEKGKINCDNWNFEIASTLVCQEIYGCIIDNICKKNGHTGNADIEVEYVRLVEKASSKRKKDRFIRLCGYHHPSRPNPTLYRKNRIINARKKTYHDAELFARESNAIDILMTKSDIDKAFGVLPKDHDYCQYIGIPIFCETASNDNKMIGLLEIVCHKDCYLSDKKEEIEEYVNLYLSPYASLLLFLFKSDKALRAVPKSTP